MAKRPFRSIWLSAVWFLLGAFPAEGARNHYFSRLTSDNGLSHNTIKCIAQDSYGFVWLGTLNGLNRYDGKTVRIIDCDDRVAGVGNHNISALHEDPARRLWVGTDKGVFLYDPSSELFTAFLHKTAGGTGITNWISAIHSNGRGNVWIVSPTEGVFRWDGEKLFHYYITPHEGYSVEHPESMCIRRNGQVWIGTTGAGLFRYYPDDDGFEQLFADRNGNSLKGEYIFAVCEYGGSLAIATHEGELKKYDLASGLISLVDAPEVHNTLIRDVKWFGGDELWVATHEGGFVIDEIRRLTTHLREETFDPYALSDKMCNVIFQDGEKGIWVGTMLGGANYCANNYIDFEKHIPYDRREGILCKKIRGVAEGPDGRIWISTDRGGLCRYNSETNDFTSFSIARKFPDDVVYKVLEDSRGMLWFGTNRGLVEFDPDSGKVAVYAREDGLPGNQFNHNAAMKDRSGRLWFGGVGGDPARNVFVLTLPLEQEEWVSEPRGESSHEGMIIPDPDIGAVSTPDGEYKVLLVEENPSICDYIADEQLGVEYLADRMCMNRSSLLRKIKSITNISAVDFIKVVRLKRAALMLREGRHRINEVCYAVGINSPSYFSKLFHGQFGMLPKEFERQNHEH